MKLKLLISALVAAPLIGAYIAPDPIHVTGFGSWFNSGGDRTFSVSGSGSNGVDSVAFSGNDACAGLGIGFVYMDTMSRGGSCTPGSSAAVNAFSSRYFRINIGGDSGFLDVFDSSLALLAHANLIGYPAGTSYVFDSPQHTSSYAHGTFIIDAVPEPATLGLAAAALACIGWKRKSRARLRESKR